MRKNVSYDLGKNILFDKMDYGENFLILYSNTNNHKQILWNLMQQMADESSIVFYISHAANKAHTANKLGSNFDIRNFSFNIINNDTIHALKDKLKKCFGEMEKKNKKVLLIADWSDTNLNDCGIFLPFLEDLTKKSGGLLVPGWRRKYKETSQKIPLTLINVFETTNLKDDFIQRIIKLHQRVYLLQENLNTFLLPTISPSSETIFPKLHILPQEMLDKLVKDNLKLITLLQLEGSNRSGYQILKDIANHFHCILSQGTLYPLLYQMEKENEITKQNGKGREVIYSLTQKTRDKLQLRKETCLKAYQHLASFFETGGAIAKK